jgi:polyhydroxyalkanoate synthase subunit PhaC
MPSGPVLNQPASNEGFDQSRIISIDAALDAFGRAQFAVTDVLRRAQGDAFAVFGFGPNECAYRVVSSGWHWRLRDYGDQTASSPLLIVAAPIKRPYIWDLSPRVTAIRSCLRAGLHVHLLEWLPASRRIGNNGLDEYAHAVSECVAQITRESRGARPFLIGHSLGGTLAAICAASAPDSIHGLVLLGAPLCFEPQTCGFRDALVSLVPSTLSETEAFPGSLLSHMSALASPSAFVWSRLLDVGFSISDRHALDIHARVERWALDEMPLPGKLVHQTIEWLYRENRLCRGSLKIGNSLIGPFSLSAPTLAVVNTADEIAPLASVKPFVDAMPAEDVRIIEYPGEVGVCLQHLGILVGRQAHDRVWPEILSWLKARS